MKSLDLRLPSRRVAYVAAAFMLLFTTLISTFASAAQVSERSITLSSSAADANDLTYQVNFTSVQSAGAVVIDICENTPLFGEDCDTPNGFAFTGATVPTAGFTDESVLDANTLRVTGTVAAATPISFEITSVDNPTAAGTIYARIVTFDNATNADAYVSNTAAEGAGGVRDTGGVALSITPSIAVSGSVLESMTFCVSAAAPTLNCGGVTPPTLALGEDVGNGVIALTPTALSTGSIYTQISTNAASGAVVRLKSSTTGCGGLARAGAASFAAGCGIAPAGMGGTVAQNEAKFGVIAASAADPSGGAPSGTFRIANASGYSATLYKLNYVSGDATGVTSTYGDPFLDTNDAPINNRNMQLTFAASATNTTPAGKYSADLSMIATGKF